MSPSKAPSLREAHSRILLISGIPATGKSTFGRWLEREKGFLHVDVEAEGVLERVGLTSTWQRMFQTGSTVAFVRALLSLGRDIVLDWGFPPAWIEIVEGLDAEGVEIWWFDGDREATRESFVRRGTVPVSALDVQMKSIQERRAEIEDVFEGRLISVVDADGRYLGPEQIWETINEGKEKH